MQEAESGFLDLVHLTLQFLDPLLFRLGVFLFEFVLRCCQIRIQLLLGFRRQHHKLSGIILAFDSGYFNLGQPHSKIDSDTVCLLR